MRPSRYWRRIGQTFTPTATTSCPPGTHWEPDAPTVIRGLSACVPDKVATLRLVRAPAPAPQPAPLPAAAPPGTASSASPDTAMAPAPVTAAECPAPWSLWWLAVAAAAGAFGGIYAAQKKRRRNAGRIV